MPCHRIALVLGGWHRVNGVAAIFIAGYVDIADVAVQPYRRRSVLVFKNGAQLFQAVESVVMGFNV